MISDMSFPDGGASCILCKEGQHHICCQDRKIDIGEKYFAYDKLPLGLELNSYRHTLHFFYNNIPIPLVVTAIPSSAVIGFSGTSILSVRSVSLERRLKPTVDARVRCTMVRWRQLGAGEEKEIRKKRIFF